MSRKWFAAAMLLVLLLAGLLSLPARADSGYALSFDGQSNYVALGDTGQLMSNDTWISAKTVSAWVRPTGETTTSMPPTSGEFIAGTDRPRIFGISRADYDGGDRLWVWNIAADGLAAVGIPFTVGEWVHVALVHDGETLHAYRNGVPVGSVPTGPTNLPREDIDGSLYLGGLARNDPSLNIQGDIDEVRFWNRALSAAEIQDWMSQELTADHAHIESLAAYYPMSDGAGTTLSDDSGNGHTGSLEGGMGDASWVLSDAFGESEATPTNTPDAPTPTPSNTPTPTNTATPTNTPEPPTPTPSNTPTNTPDAPTPTPSNTPTNTPEPPTPTPSNTPTSTPDAPTPTPTNTPAPPTPTPTSSASGGDPVEVGFYETAGDAYDLALVGNTVYVADVAGGLRIIDVTDPAAPQELGFHETPRKAYGVAADAAYAYVAVGAQGIRIYDVTNPANPVEVGAFDTPSYAWDLEVGGDFLYVADRWSGFHIIDVSERTALVHVAAVSTPDEALSLAIDGDYAYVAAYTSGLRIVDISDPANAHEVASAAAGRAYGVTVSDGYAYVAGGGEGLCLVDVATPTQPVQLGCHNTDGWSRSVSVTGDYAYLADWTGGFRVIDVSDPANPLQSGFHDTTGRPRDVIVSGGYAYVAAYEGGLRILRI